MRVFVLLLCSCATELPPLSRWDARVSEGARIRDFERHDPPVCARVLELSASCCERLIPTDMRQSGELRIVLPETLRAGRTVAVSDHPLDRYAYGGQVQVYDTRHIRGEIDVLSVGKNRARLNLRLVATQPQVGEGDRDLMAVVDARVAKPDCGN